MPTFAVMQNALFLPRFRQPCPGTAVVCMSAVVSVSVTLLN